MDRVRHLLATLAFLLAAPCSAAQIALVLSDRSAPILAAQEAFQTYLARKDAGVPALVVIDATETPAQVAREIGQSSIVVSVGAAAMRVVHAQATGAVPVLDLLVPRAGFEATPCPGAERGTRRCSAIFLDQPLARQEALVKAALPGRHRIGLVAGPSSRAIADDLRQSAPALGLTAVVEELVRPDDLYDALQAVLAESDVLLTEPDPMVLTGATARSVLISAYRHAVPVVSFTENFVNAGATLGVFSTPEQVAREAAEWVAAALAGAELGAPRYPRYFAVKVNQQVARSLGLAIPDEQSLLLRLSEPRS